VKSWSGFVFADSLSYRFTWSSPSGDGLQNKAAQTAIRDHGKEYKKSTSYRRTPDRREKSFDLALGTNIKNNAGSTRKIGAAFQPEGGIFFRAPAGGLSL
jgi:hypothetical protein